MRLARASKTQVSLYYYEHPDSRASRSFIVLTRAAWRMRAGLCSARVGTTRFGLEVALRCTCRARAGFSRRSRENPDVWFRPCIAGQVRSYTTHCSQSLIILLIYININYKIHLHKILARTSPRVFFVFGSCVRVSV